jgi:hypothetical protein
VETSFRRCRFVLLFDALTSTRDVLDKTTSSLKAAALRLGERIRDRKRWAWATMHVTLDPSARSPIMPISRPLVLKGVPVRGSEADNPWTDQL